MAAGACFFLTLYFPQHLVPQSTALPNAPEARHSSASNFSAVSPAFVFLPQSDSAPSLLLKAEEPLAPAALPDAPQQSQPKPAEPTKKTKHSPAADTGSPGHIFWIVPAYKVTYQQGFTPLSPHEKFQEWAQSEYDPLGLVAGAAEAATLEYSSTDGFCGYGHGWAGYGKCFGSMQLDAADSSFIGDYALTVLLHQDPRYFRLGKGSFATRALYSISRVFVTFNDHGKNTLYTSGLTGTVVAGVVSNLYYPKSDTGVGPTIDRIGIDFGNTALYNGAAEFWPDFHRKIGEIF